MKLLQILLERAKPGGKYRDIFKYADDENVHVSFTEIAYKSGLNPRTLFNTPLGIYCYPLKASIKYYKLNPESYNQFPFAQNREYVNVLKSGNNISVLHSDKYSESDYESDMEKLKKWAQNFPNRKIVDELSEYYENARNAASVPDKPMGLIWYITYMISKNFSDLKSRPPVFWNYLLRKILNYDLVVDTGFGIIHPNEPCQSVFLSNHGYRLIDVISNKQPRSHYEYQGYVSKFSRMLQSAVESNRENTFKKIWNTMDSFLERIDRTSHKSQVGSLTIAKLSMHDKNRAYEFIKRFIKWTGVNEVASWDGSVKYDTRQLVAKALTVFINDIDSRNLRNMMATYDIPYSVLFTRFGKNNMSDAIRWQSSDKLLTSLQKNPNNILYTLQSLGKDHFSKLLKYWMVDTNISPDRTNVLTLISKLDLEGVGGRLRGDKKIRSILDITDESFHVALAKLISDETSAFLYSTVPRELSSMYTEFYLVRLLLSMYSRLKSYWSESVTKKVLMQTAAFTGNMYGSSHYNSVYYKFGANISQDRTNVLKLISKGMRWQGGGRRRYRPKFSIL